MNTLTPESLAELTRRFNSLLEFVPFLEGINSEREYQKALETTEILLQAIDDNPNDPRNVLLEMITRQIEAYEYRTHPVLSQWDQQDGAIALLKTLIRQHDLKQSDLSEIGSQGVVSEVLRGKRSMNLNQIKKLAARFDLDPMLFIQDKSLH